MYVWVGRVFGALVLVGSVLLATAFDTILQLLKFTWEWNIVVAPAFWVGMRWRRANRLGAWASIVGSALLFFLLPVVMVTAMPQLRTHESLLKTTDPQSLRREYEANEADVAARDEQIARWDQLTPEQQAATPRPESIELGQRFVEEFRVPKKAIFWTQGIQMTRQPDGRSTPVGAGQLSLELVALDALGVDLTRNAYAMNETIRIIIRMVVPFAILFVFTFLGRQEDSVRTDRFFAKMRTKVRTDKEEDAREMAHAMADPDYNRQVLLRPGSSWEFFKWGLQDWVGFLLAVLTVFGILAAMAWLVSLGKG